MNTKEELHRIIEHLSEEEAQDLLDMLVVREEPDVLSPEEKASVEEGEKQIERGEYIDLNGLRRKIGR